MGGGVSRISRCTKRVRQSLHTDQILLQGSEDNQGQQTPGSAKKPLPYLDLRRVASPPPARHLDHTPIGEESEVFRFYCPLCMMYFTHIFETTCCHNYSCYTCALSYVNSKESTKSPTLLLDHSSLNCPHCVSKGFSFEFVSERAHARQYSDSPTTATRLKQQSQNRLHSPLRVGDNWETMTKKLNKFEEVGIVSKTGERVMMLSTDVLMEADECEDSVKSQEGEEDEKQEEKQRNNFKYMRSKSAESFNRSSTRKSATPNTHPNTLGYWMKAPSDVHPYPNTAPAGLIIDPNARFFESCTPSRAGIRHFSYDHSEFEPHQIHNNLDSQPWQSSQTTQTTQNMGNLVSNISSPSPVEEEITRIAILPSTHDTILMQNGLYTSQTPPVTDPNQINTFSVNSRLNEPILESSEVLPHIISSVPSTSNGIAVQDHEFRVQDISDEHYAPIIHTDISNFGEVLDSKKVEPTEINPKSANLELFIEKLSCSKPEIKSYSPSSFTNHGEKTETEKHVPRFFNRNSNAKTPTLPANMVEEPLLGFIPSYLDSTESLIEINTSAAKSKFLECTQVNDPGVTHSNDLNLQLKRSFDGQSPKLLGVVYPNSSFSMHSPESLKEAPYSNYYDVQVHECGVLSTHSKSCASPLVIQDKYQVQPFCVSQTHHKLNPVSLSMTTPECGLSTNPQDFRATTNDTLHNEHITNSPVVAWNAFDPRSSPSNVYCEELLKCDRLLES